jgi:hypothetical protein
MARVNVEQIALTDPRMKHLGKLIGSDVYGAIGRMVFVWNRLQERGAYTLTPAELANLTDVEEFARHLIAAKLGRKEGREVYICGSKGRVEWLTAARENGRLGGRPKGSRRGNHAVTETKPSGLFADNPPPLPLAPALPPSGEEREISRYAGARALPSIARWDFLVERHRQFHENVAVNEMQAADPEAYAEEFRKSIGYTPDEFAALREQMGEVGRIRRPSSYILRLVVDRRRRATDGWLQLTLPFVLGACA